MLWILILLVAMAANVGAQASTPARTDGARPTQRSTQPTPKLLSAAMPSSAEDRAAESTLLQLVNQRRREAGVPPLRAEEGLTEAARADRTGFGERASAFGRKLADRRHSDSTRLIRKDRDR